MPDVAPQRLPALLSSILSEPFFLRGDVFSDLRLAAVRIEQGERVDVPGAMHNAGRPTPEERLARMQSRRGEGNGSGAQADYIVVDVGGTGVAVMDIWGVLVKSDAEASVENWYGELVRIGTSYEMIRRGMHAAMHDRTVHAVLMRFDSPGGAAMPVEPVSAELFAMAGGFSAGGAGAKPIVAYADDMMASAALYLGSQANAVWATPGSFVGSIGTIAMYADYSQMLARWGMKVTAIKSNPLKDAGSPYREMTDTDRGVLQAEVDAFGRQFDQALVRGRGVDAARVESWKSGRRGFVGSAGVEAGVVDAIVPTIEEAIAHAAQLARGGAAVLPPKSSTRPAAQIAAALPAAAPSPSPSAAAPAAHHESHAVSLTPHHTHGGIDMSRITNTLPGGGNPLASFAGNGSIAASAGGGTGGAPVSGNAAPPAPIAGAIPGSHSAVAPATQPAGQAQPIAQPSAQPAAQPNAQPQQQGQTQQAQPTQNVQPQPSPVNDARIAEINARALPFAQNPAIAALRDRAILSGQSPAEFASAAMAALANASPPTAHVPNNGQAQAPGTESLRVDDSRRQAGIDAHAMGILCNAEPALVAKLDPPVGDNEAMAVRDTLRAERIARGMGFENAAAARAAVNAARREGMHSRSLKSLAAACVATAVGIPHIAAESLMASDPAGFMAMLRNRRPEGGRYASASFAGSSDFPHILSNLQHKVLMGSFAEVETVWQRICRRGTFNDYKDHPMIALSEAANFEEVLEGKAARVASFNERKEGGTPKIYAIADDIHYKMIRNDDLNALTRKAALFGQSAARLPDQLIFEALAMNSGGGPTMSDGVAFFHANHGNLQSSPSALGQSTLESEYTLMRTRQGWGQSGSSSYVTITPRVLLVETSRELTAQKLVSNQYELGSTGAQLTENVMRGKLTPFASPRVRTATSWYLFADPNDIAAFVMAFLDGQETPEMYDVPVEDPLCMRRQFTIKGVAAVAVQYEGARYNPGS
jgi:signal peptide peptidase SppA